MIKCCSTHNVKPNNYVKLPLRDAVIVAKVIDKKMAVISVLPGKLSCQILYKTQFNVLESYSYTIFTYYMHSCNIWIVNDDKNG